MTDADSLRNIAHSRAPFSVWFGTILLFMLFGAIVLALIGPAPRRDRHEESHAQKRLDNLKTLYEADAKALSGYGWVDKAKGTVHIPIERAMQLTMAELSQKKTGYGLSDCDGCSRPRGGSATDRGTIRRAEERFITGSDSGRISIANLVQYCAHSRTQGEGSRRPAVGNSITTGRSGQPAECQRWQSAWREFQDASIAGRQSRG